MATSSTTNPAPDPLPPPEPGQRAADHSLQDEASQILPRVQAAFRRAIAEIPDLAAATAEDRPLRPTSVCKALGIHQTLAWKIVQIVKGTDAFAIAPHIPGESGVRIFLKAARQHGAGAAAAADLERAVEAYRGLIDAHAGDRVSMELMLTSAAREPSGSVELQHRRAGFRCNSYVWGVQARARVHATILFPSARAGWFDLAAIRGFISVRRVRPEARWTLSRRRTIDSDGNPTAVPLREPIDPTGVLHGDIPLLRPFCSQPLPPLERVQRPDGNVEDRLAPGPAGGRAAMTLFTGDLARQVGQVYRNDLDTHMSVGARMQTPVEVFSHDYFVDSGLFGRVEPQFLVYSELGEMPWFHPSRSGRNAELPDAETLPTSDQILYLGRADGSMRPGAIGLEGGANGAVGSVGGGGAGGGGGGLTHPDYPRYGELLAYVFGKLGLDPARFDVYRTRVEYPVLQTALVSRFELPAEPGTR